MEETFGDLQDFESANPIPFTMYIGHGENGNWIILNCIYPKAKEVTNKCVEIAAKNDIMLFDPQQVCVWNNIRPK